MSIDNHLPTLYQQFIYKSKYSKWLEEESRREDWPETVTRYINFYKEKTHNNLNIPWEPLYDSILNLQIMPSMRAMMTAGPAAERSNIATYNCSFVAANYQDCFKHILLILMNGTGVGFSVERQEIAKLPTIEPIKNTDPIIILVEDSKEGWSTAFGYAIELLYSGINVEFDVSKVRPAGDKLKTFGGRSSGPAPLLSLLTFTKNIFKKAEGRKLNSLEVHDVICKIADIVVVGGVRRSALISLSNLSDDRMRQSKTGQWWDSEPQRQLANNSAVYTEEPSAETWLHEFTSIINSKSGERGIFNRESIPKERFINYDGSLGTNPCGEILLRSKQFCNLSEVVVRPEDTEQSIVDKVVLATILGTLQATLTDFPMLDKEWEHNCKEEALLGVSLTGIADNESLFYDNFLQDLNKLAIFYNKEYAEVLGINPAAAVTCIKPSGTVSQLVNSSSGIHDRFAPYYLRAVRADNHDPLTQFMKDQGIPWEPCISKPDSTSIFSFPIKAPENSKQVTALEQLERWKLFKVNYTDHNPSVTIHYSEDEIFHVASWVYDNWEYVGGITILPKDDHIYEQAPYQEISKQQYIEAEAKMPKSVNWSLLNTYETEDHTTAMQEPACSAGICEI